MALNVSKPQLLFVPIQELHETDKDSKRNRNKMKAQKCGELSENRFQFLMRNVYEFWFRTWWIWLIIHCCHFGRERIIKFPKILTHDTEYVAVSSVIHSALPLSLPRSLSLLAADSLSDLVRYWLRKFRTLRTTNQSSCLELNTERWKLSTLPAPESVHMQTMLLFELNERCDVK